MVPCLRFTGVDGRADVVDVVVVVLVVVVVEACVVGEVNVVDGVFLVVVDVGRAVVKKNIINVKNCTGFVRQT
jgi:hypothetical protein